MLVSENSTSYGKDLGDLRALETLLPQLADVDGIERVRVSYLQPAELRPALLEVIATTPGVAPYFDLSFQHASRTGAAPDAAVRLAPTRFLDLLARVRERWRPDAGARSNVIVGFPGETEADVAELERFLAGRPARRDRRVRLLRRGRHRGRRLRRQAATPTRSPRGSSASARSPTN